MEDVHSAVTSAPDVVESLSCPDEVALERAVAKLALLGDQVGVDVGQMIALLESGLSVVELVEYLATRSPQRLCD